MDPRKPINQNNKKNQTEMKEFTLESTSDASTDKVVDSQRTYPAWPISALSSTIKNTTPPTPQDMPDDSQHNQATSALSFFDLSKDVKDNDIFPNMSAPPASQDVPDDSQHNKKAEPVLSPLSQDIKNEKIYPHLTLNVLGVFAQVSQRAEAETAFLRLLPSAVDAEPESYQWYDFVLMSSLRENKKGNAEKNKIYLADDGRYLVRDQKGIVREGKIDKKTQDLSDLQKKLHAPALKNKLFDLISKADHAPAYKETTQLAAIAILKRHPELLFREGIVKDHFGRKIKASPYRLLLGAGDVWALKQVHEKILPHIKGKNGEDGETLAKLEFQKQFPGYQGSWPMTPDMPEEALYDDRNRAQITDVQTQLAKIVAAITADPCTNGVATRPETTEAVAGLRKLFTPKEGEIIKTGLHFPLGIMNEICQVYAANFNQWSYAKLAFFSRTVIGSAEAALSAVDGQCVKNGLTNLTMSQGPDRRDGLFCRRPIGIPHEKAPLVGKLGSVMFVDPYGQSCFLSSSPGVFDWYNKSVVKHCGPVIGGAGCFGKLMENKSRYYCELMQPHFDAPTHRLAGHN